MRRSAVLALVVLTGCSAVSLRTRRAAEDLTLAPRVIAVYPYRFRWTEPAWRSYQKSRDLVAQLLADGRFAVIAPGEFEVFRPEDDNVAAASTLIHSLIAEGYAPADAVVLRAWAEAQVDESTRTTYDDKGNPVGVTQDRRRVFIAHLEVVDVDRRRVLLEGSARIEEDPFAVGPEWDPLWQLAEANRELVAWALDGLEGEAPREIRLGARLLANPGRAFDFQEHRGAPEAAQALARLDPLDQETVRFSVYAYFDREVPVERKRLYDREPRGALVLEVEESGPAQAAGLVPGDLVVECDGLPVTGPEVLLRRLRLRPKARLTVLREGESRTVDLTAE